MWQRLDGQKTKIVSALLVLISAYIGLDKVFDDSLPDFPLWLEKGLQWLLDNWAMGVLGGVGLYSMRDAVRKLEK